MLEPLEESLAALKRFGAATASQQAVLDEVVRVVADTLAVPMCKILELTSDASELVVRSGVGWQPGVIGVAKVSAKSDSQPGYTLVQGTLVLFDDLPRTLRFTGAALARRHGIVSSVCIPIGEPHPYGVLCAHDVKKRTFTPEERHFLRRVAAEVLHDLPTTDKHSNARRS